MNNEEHNCDLCEKCNKYYDNDHDCRLCEKCNEYCIDNHKCDLCVECNTYKKYVSWSLNKCCDKCSQKWCTNCFSVKNRCSGKHTGTICCILGNINCEAYYHYLTHNH